MNKRIKELAKKAGFCFWTNESWKPEGATIDWSCNYDDHMEKFAELVMHRCLDIVTEKMIGHDTKLYISIVCALDDEFRID
jgi:hypothetical protein